MPRPPVLALLLCRWASGAGVVPTPRTPPGLAESLPRASAPPDVSQVVPYFEQFVTFVECENMTVT